MHFKLRLIPTAVATLLVAACGGGGGSSTVASNPVNGTLVDGYLNFAKVVCDVNENGKYDVGEPVTYTSNTGDGKFTFNPGCTHSTLGGVDGTGTNADTNLPFVGLLRAPAGASVITPLTTLLAAGMTAKQITAALNLPADTNLLTADPAATNTDGSLKTPDLLKKTLAVQQLLQKTTETVNGLAGMSGSVSTAAVYTEVANALATTLNTGTALIGSDGTMASSVVNSMLTTAVTSIGNSSTVDATVKAALTQAGGAATLPTVMTPALTAQAQALLNTSDTTITATVLDRQSNTAITDTVKAAASAGALSATTTPADLTTLATTTSTEAAKPSVASNHVPSPASGSNTLSFDEGSPAFTGMGAYGGALPSVEVPANSDAGMALKIVKPVGGQVWGGIYFGTVQAIPFTSTRKSITAAVYSTRAGAVIKFKVQVSETDFVEVAGTPTGAANTWSTVTWDFSAVDSSKVYNTVAITPDATLEPSGQTYYLDNIALAPASGTPPVGDYLYLPNNAIGFSADGSTANAVSYTLTTFQSSGINIKWPMSNGAALKLNLAENGTFNIASGQTLTAAVQIEDTAGQGQIRAYTDGVTVTKSGSNITLNVPNLPQALIYGISGDGNTKAVINFASKVQGISNVLSTAANAVSTVMFGEVVNYGITGLSNQFTNMSALRGKYKVTIVVNQLPLKKADGSAFDNLTIQMPTSVVGGVASGIVPVTGAGLVGYINLID